MTKGVSIGKEGVVSGAQRDGPRPSKVSVWSGSARRKQRDHGASVCLERDAGRGDCGSLAGTERVFVSDTEPRDTARVFTPLKRCHDLTNRRCS